MLNISEGFLLPDVTRDSWLGTLPTPRPFAKFNSKLRAMKRSQGLTAGCLHVFPFEQSVLECVAECVAVGTESWNWLVGLEPVSRLAWVIQPLPSHGKGSGASIELHLRLQNLGSRPRDRACKRWACLQNSTSPHEGTAGKDGQMTCAPHPDAHATRHPCSHLPKWQLL